MSEPGDRPLVTISPAQQSVELRRSQLAETMRREWRRTWQGVYAQCIVLVLIGYSTYGLSLAVRSGEQSGLIVAVSFVIAYVLPFFRLVHFFVKHSDQF